MRISTATKRIAKAGWTEVSRGAFHIDYCRQGETLRALLVDDSGCCGPDTVPTTVSGMIRNGDAYNSFTTCIK